MKEKKNKICLVIPVYNEETRLEVNTYREFLENNKDVSIVFVDDASKDNSIAKLNLIKNGSTHVTILDNYTNQGKAESIRNGMLYAHKNADFRYYGFIDADLAVPLSDIKLLSGQLTNSTSSVAIGIRNISNKQTIRRTAVRKFLSRLFRCYVEMVFSLRVSDTQCGIKLFKREIIPMLYNAPFKTRWLSDIELLLHIKKHSTNNNRAPISLVEVEVSRFEDKSGSKMRWNEFFRVFYELTLLSADYILAKSYKQSVSESI